MVCYNLAHQIRWAKHTFSGRCDITPMVCCSFGGHSTPQFLQCIEQYILNQRENKILKFINASTRKVLLINYTDTGLGSYSLEVCGSPTVLLLYKAKNTRA